MKTRKILFSIVAIFAVTMGFLLDASPAQATEVIRDGDTALGIRGLTVRFMVGSTEVYKVYDGESTIGRGEEARIRTDARDQSAVARHYATRVHRQRCAGAGDDPHDGLLVRVREG